MARRPPTRQDLGRAIRHLREERGLTIEGLAGEAGMHPTYLSGIERGQVNPSWDKLIGLSRALGMALSEIVRDSERGRA